MPKGQIEHVNITVTDIERSSVLFQKLLGWHERWRGPAINDGTTIHVGDDTTYLAIHTHDNASGGHPKGTPLNHIGLLVDDIDAAEQVVIDAGLTPTSHGDYEPGRRFYFDDWDGIEFEIVSYTGDAS